MMRTQILYGLERIKAQIDETAWRKIVATSSGSSFFQQPGWCFAWYEAYSNEWEPLLVTATLNNRLVGVAALARHRVSHEVTFAGAGLADYHDVLVCPEYRTQAVEALLRAILPLTQGRFVLGPTQLDSTTIREAAALSAGDGPWDSLVRSDSCWRVRLTQTEVGSLKRKQQIKRMRAFYSRLGKLRYQRIRTAAEWEAFREVYFEQHNLRQLYVGRPLSFTDKRKRQLFDMLFARDPDSVHISALWLNDHCLASHFGYSLSGTIYWGAPAMDVREHSRAPGLLHLVYLIDEAFQEGYAELDFTTGSESFKARFGTDCVEIQKAILYCNARQYWVARMRQVAATITKSALRSSPTLQWPRVNEWVKKQWPRDKGSAGGPRRKRVRSSDITLVATHDNIRLSNGEETKGVSLEFHENSLGDLAHSKDPNLVRQVLLDAVEARDQRTLHTLMVDGQLATYGWEQRTQNEIHLHGFTVLSREGERWLALQLGVISLRGLERGVARVLVTCRKSAGTLASLLEEAGFQRCSSSKGQFTSVGSEAIDGIS